MSPPSARPRLCFLTPPSACLLTKFVRLEQSLAISSLSCRTSTDFSPWPTAKRGMKCILYSVLYRKKGASQLGTGLVWLGPKDAEYWGNNNGIKFQSSDRLSMAELPPHRTHPKTISRSLPKPKASTIARRTRPINKLPYQLVFGLFLSSCCSCARQFVMSYIPWQFVPKSFCR